MRLHRFFIAGTILGALTLCGCDVSSMTTLAEISRPYVGEYVCETLTLGGEDLLDRFETVKLTLGYDGAFRLSYRDRLGAEGGYGGVYEMNAACDAVTFSARRGLRTVSRTFPVRSGAIYADLNLQGKLLHAEFRFP